MQLKFKGFDEPIRHLNNKIEYYLSEVDQKKLKQDEKHIISDRVFQRAIEDARNSLGLSDDPDDFLDYESNLKDWICVKLSGKGSKEISSDEYSACLERLLRAAVTVIEKANLPHGWLEYIEAYIALGGPPQNAVIEPEIRIRVEGIDTHENSLILELDKGLTYEEYKKAWKAFKDFLRQPSVYRPYSDVLKNRIYLDHQKGLTAGVIAKDYFPLEYKKDRLATVDKVKKIIARYNT